MIRNVKDNNRQASPYATRDTNLRLGRFYSNRLDTGKSASSAAGSESKKRRSLPLQNFMSLLATRFWA